MIYLDHNATTPVLPEVFEAMIRFSLGMENTAQEVETAIAAVRRAVHALKG